VKFQIRYDLPVEVNAVWQSAIAKLMGELGKNAGPIDAIKAMCEMVLATDAEEKTPPDSPRSSPGSPRSCPGRKARKDPIYTVILHVGPDGQAWHQGRDGESPVPIEAVLGVMDSATVLEVPDPEPTGPEGASAIRLGERGSVPPEERDRPAPAGMREMVSLREGDCCAICGSRKDLRTHHVDSLANGGKTVIRRLVTVCGLHHSLIHEGLLVLGVDERGKAWAKTKDGPIVGRELPAREVLIDAPEELAFTEVDVSPRGRVTSRGEPAAELGPGDSPESMVEKSPTWDNSSSQVVAVPHPPAGETTTSRPAVEEDDGPVAVSPCEGTRPTEDAAVESPVEPREAAAAAASVAPKSPTWDNPPSQVVSSPRSPMSNRLAYASLEELPSVLTAPEWWALEARLEWSAKRNLFVLGDDPGSGPALGGVLSPLAETERTHSPDLRPGTLAEVTGQERAVEGLSLAIEAARIRRDALDHVLLSGEPGLGKTTLAGALAREMGSRLHAAMGADLKEPAHVIGLLTRLEPRDVLFIDEIHRLERPVTECLHSAMEDRMVHLVVAERGSVRPLRVALEPFTLAGATMEPGVLPEAFRARFGIRTRLEPYSEEVLAQIVERAAPALGLEALPDASMAIARRSRGTPREALRLLRRARDAAQTAGSAVIEVSHVEESARLLGIDPDGLGPEDRRILEVLVRHRRPSGSQRSCPMGLQTLAAMTGIDQETIRNNHEPYLLRKGYVVRTARGRDATPAIPRILPGGPVPHDGGQRRP
jgi:Holliday junction DNA helicase RuvB